MRNKVNVASVTCVAAAGMAPLHRVTMNNGAAWMGNEILRIEIPLWHDEDVYGPGTA